MAWRDSFALALMVASLLAGCATQQEAPSTTVAPPHHAADAGVASYLHDLSPRDKGITYSGAKIQHERIPASDGVGLDTWIALPPGAGPFPVILHLTPYYSGGAPTTMGRLGDEFLPRGYAVVLSNVRGTGNSGGCFLQGGPQEAKDNAAVVEFLAAQPWSNGNVGIIGVSYDGTTPQETWVEAPPHLKTIVPIAGISDFYKYNFVNGVPIFIQGYGFNTYYWAEEDALWDGFAPGDPTDVPGTLESIQGVACPDQLDVQQGGVDATATGNKGPYWQTRDFLARLMADQNKTRASVFYVHGLQDWNVKDHHMEGWLDAVQATGVPMKIWLGQWPHAWPQSTSTSVKCRVVDGHGQACRNDWWNTTLVAWFDQFLKGRDTGILETPRVQVQDDDGAWRMEERWPPVDVDALALHPSADGSLSEKAGTGAVAYSDLTGDSAAGTFFGGPIPDARGPGAVFRSEPVAQDLHLSGLPRFEGYVTADGPRASLILTLAEETPDGVLRAINFAAQSLNHVRSLEQGDDDISRVRQQVSVDFFPQDDVVHSGSRIVLMAAGNIVAGDQPGPALQPVQAGTTITLDMDGAALRLPVDGSIVPEDPQPYAK